MKEIRCLVFTEAEVCQAILAARAANGRFVPPGTLREIDHDRRAELLTSLFIVADDGVVQRLVVGEAELTAALWQWLTGRTLPVPDGAETWLELMGAQLALVVAPGGRQAGLEAAPADAAAEAAAAPDLADRLTDWLVQRLPAISRQTPQRWRWPQLRQQFGVEAERMGDFQNRFAAALEIALDRCPNARVERQAEGLVLHHSLMPAGRRWSRSAA